jgi:hypothetical protein
VLQPLFAGHYPYHHTPTTLDTITPTDNIERVMFIKASTISQKGA